MRPWEVIRGYRRPAWEVGLSLWLNPLCRGWYGNAEFNQWRFTKGSAVAPVEDFLVSMWMFVLFCTSFMSRYILIESYDSMYTYLYIYIYTCISYVSTYLPSFSVVIPEKPAVCHGCHLCRSLQPLSGKLNEISNSRHWLFRDCTTFWLLGGLWNHPFS